MSDDVYLSLDEAKKYVGRGFSANFLKTSKNEFGSSLGYSVSDLDAFIAKRDSRAKKQKRVFIGFPCSLDEFEEIQNFKKIHDIGYRELVLRIVRNVNNSPELLELFNGKFK